MDILDRFIAQAKENIASGYYAATHLEEGVPYSQVSLKQMLLSKPFSLITEIKHASPAGEYSFDFIDVEKTAFSFKAAGADAISVVVEPKIFKGNIYHITIAKKVGLPVLFKDFVFSREQIDAASKVGADAVLLVVKVAERVGSNVNELIDHAHERGLEVLLECYNEKEMEFAIKTNADILGINNRDLQTLKVDITRTKQILDCFKSIDKPIISESGIRNKNDVNFIKKTGVKGILVGTAIWKSTNIEEKVRELKG